MDAITPFDIEGLTPIEVLEKIDATIMALTEQAIRFAREKAQDEIEEAYQEGYKDGMTEAVTRITE